LAVAIFTSSCVIITDDLDRIVGLEVEGGLQRSVEENGSIQLIAWAISAGGDTVPDADIVWDLLDVDSGQVGFTLEPSTGLVVAYSPGTGSVRPRVEAVTPKTPITITVTPAPDTVSATGEQAVTMTAVDVVSPPLTVGLSDLTTPSDSVVPLPEKEVQFLVVFPDPGTAETAGFFLTRAATDTVPQSDPHTVSVRTDGSSRASAYVRRIAGAVLPDSAVVHARASTAAGGTVPGSPVRFVVIFERN
jgi:hypothetical protein